MKGITCKQKLKFVVTFYLEKTSKLISTEKNSFKMTLLAKFLQVLKVQDKN